MPTALSAQLILMLRTYAFSGRKKIVLGILSATFFGLVGIIIWVISKELTLSPISVVFNRTSCFAISDQPTRVVLAAGTTQESEGSVPGTLFHMGLISIFSASFDGLNMFLVIWQCIRDRGILGPLGQSFLKQGKSSSSSSSSVILIFLWPRRDTGLRGYDGTEVIVNWNYVQLKSIT
ncbi:hypothetical protein V8E53_015746 [Lactarius tabidus]